MPAIPDLNQNDDEFIVGFHTSRVFEFLCSVEAALSQWRFPLWSQKLKEYLGEGFLEEFKRYQEYELRYSLLGEIAIDFDHGKGIEDFFQYLEEMSLVDFIFYVSGRVMKKALIDRLFKPSESSEDIDPKDLNGDNCLFYPAVLRRQLLQFWKTYYYDFYRHVEEDFSVEYRNALSEWKHFYQQRGALELYKKLGGKKGFPKPIPRNTPYHRIRIVPVHRLSSRNLVYHGFGEVTILFSSIPRKGEVQQKDREKILEELKALADSSRLEILKSIADGDYLNNGKRIAERMNLSPSVVSRHIKQLKKAGLIKDQTIDNRNYFYAVNREAIQGLTRGIQDFLADDTEEEN